MIFTIRYRLYSSLTLVRPGVPPQTKNVGWLEHLPPPWRMRVNIQYLGVLTLWFSAFLSFNIIERVCEENHLRICVVAYWCQKVIEISKHYEVKNNNDDNCNPLSSLNLYFDEQWLFTDTEAIYKTACNFATIYCSCLIFWSNKSINLIKSSICIF